MLQLGVAQSVHAQVGVQKDTIKSVNEVVVTGVTNPKAALSSSISVSTLRPDQIDRAAPRTTAEIFLKFRVSAQSHLRETETQTCLFAVCHSQQVVQNIY